jgi:ribonuclease D
LLNVNLSKQQQSTYWGDSEISKEQLNYAASDVLYLHKLKMILTRMLQREDRTEISNQCFTFLPNRAILDIIGWEDIDIFAH